MRGWSHCFVASAVSVLIIRFTLKSVSSPNDLIERVGDVQVKFTAAESFNSTIVSNCSNCTNTYGSESSIEENVVESEIESGARIV